MLLLSLISRAPDVSDPPAQALNSAKVTRSGEGPRARDIRRRTRNPFGLKSVSRGVDGFLFSLIWLSSRRSWSHRHVHVDARMIVTIRRQVKFFLFLGGAAVPHSFT